jgi:hypothetical protein
MGLHYQMAGSEGDQSRQGRKPPGRRSERWEPQDGVICQSLRDGSQGEGRCNGAEQDRGRDRRNDEDTDGRIGTARNETDDGEGSRHKNVI